MPGCVADGETVDVAIAEAHDAFELWQGGRGGTAGQGALPVPKSPHQRLATRAAAESVRLNQLAATDLAPRVGRRQRG